jgi:hypothetical protein
MDNPSRPMIRGVQTWARAAAVAELRPALAVPSEIAEAYVDAAAVLVEAEQRHAAYVLLRNLAWPPGRSAPADAAAAAWRILVRGRRRPRVSHPAAVDRPKWAEFATRLGADGPLYFLHEVLDLIELRGKDRPHVSVDVAQFDGSAPVVQLEASTYGTPVRLEPAESRLVAAALDEAAKIVDRARTVEA